MLMIRLVCVLHVGVLNSSSAVSSSPLQRAKEDVLQKEVKVKILKDSINLLVSRSAPSAGGGGQELTSELEGVLANYHKLCDRFKSKCHTLEVTCDAVRSLHDGECYAVYFVGEYKYKKEALHAAVKVKSLVIVLYRASSSRFECFLAVK